MPTRRMATPYLGLGGHAARYHLFQILLMNAKTDADREHAGIVLKNAADPGHAQVQFTLGPATKKETV